MIGSMAGVPDGAGQAKLGKDAGRSPSMTGWASPRTQTQRRYGTSTARARVVEPVI